MRVRVSTGDAVDPTDCPHQFVGRCDQCSAVQEQAQLAEPPPPLNPWKIGLPTSTASPQDPYGEPPR